MLLSPPTFTSNLPTSTNIDAPSSKRRCINPVLSASRALHAITSMNTTTTDTLPSMMLFGAPLQMPLSPPMEGAPSLPKRRALRRKQVQEKGDKRRKTVADVRKEVQEEKKSGKMSLAKKTKMPFATPDQRSFPTEVPRGLTRTVFAQAFEPTRPRSFSDQDDQDLIALVANTLSSPPTPQQPQAASYTTTKACPTTPSSNSRKRRRED